MERKESEDARYSELLTTTPVDMPVKSEDDTIDQGTGVSPEGEGSSVAASPGLHQREAYCLLVRVTHNVDSVSTLDVKVPDYVWTEVIAWDICTHWVGAPANTFTVELLSDTEFLLFEGPQSGPGINWENAIAYIRILHDIRDWGSMEVTMVASQHTMKQSWIDLANMREYHRACILGRLATVEGKARSLAIENAKTPTPQGIFLLGELTITWHRGWVGGLALEPTLHVLRPATPEDYHSAREPSEFKYGSQGLEGSGTDSTGYSSTTMATSHHGIHHTQCSKNRDHKRQKQKHSDWWKGRETNARKLKDQRNGRVVLPLFQESTKEGGIDVH